MPELMTIEEFARQGNTSVRNVRAYVERGLLPPGTVIKRIGYYDNTHLELLEIIRRLQGEGFSLAAIRTLLQAWQAGVSLDEVIGARRDRGEDDDL